MEGFIFMCMHMFMDVCVCVCVCALRPGVKWYTSVLMIQTFPLPLAYLFKI